MKKKYTMEEVVKILADHGFEAAGWRGSHYRMRRGEVVIHISKNNTLWRVYVKNILKKAGILESEIE